MYSALAGACKYSIGKGEVGFNMVGISIYRTNHFGESKCNREGVSRNGKNRQIICSLRA
uniref:Uncharacterized protein n=1 Tax=Siphoviridae sp. ctk4d14 TaxID=2825639 RepID=A0A8S5QJB2_9CAUD|nr:MAG TPA: hypothetical protein [Siphoviridae sp. ctk4d14]